MKITITIEDTNQLTFDEVSDVLKEDLENNGIDVSDSNVQIVDADEQGDPNELEDAPLQAAPQPNTNPVNGQPAGLSGTPPVV